MHGCVLHMGFAEDVLAMADLGFKETRVAEPVVSDQAPVLSS